MKLDLWPDQGYVLGMDDLDWLEAELVLAVNRKLDVWPNEGILLGMDDPCWRAGSRHLAGRGDRPQRGRPGLAEVGLFLFQPNRPAEAKGA